MDAAVSPARSPARPRLPRPPAAVETPIVDTRPKLVTPLSSTAEGFRTEREVDLSALLAAEGPVCVISVARIYDPSMDVHFVQEIHDMATRLLTRHVILLAKPLSPGNGAWQVKEALRRLKVTHGIACVHEPSDGVINQLGISDNRGGLCNAIHRFDRGVLVRSWVAPVRTPREEFYAGRHVLTTRR